MFENSLVKEIKKDDKNILVINSVEVANILGKDHKDILRMIDGRGKVVGLIPTLLGANFALNDYFIESTYKAANNRKVKCYLCTEMGCQLIGNKLQGEEAILYSARYVQEFNRMKQLITDLQLGKPEAIIGLLTWKNSNMETTIRKYINGSNVINILPAIAEECKKQVLSGELKLEVLTTAIRTTRQLRDEESNMAYRDLYNQAIEKARDIKDSILNGRLGGVVSSKNLLAEKCKRLEDKKYEEEDFWNFVDDSLEDKALKIASETLKMYVDFIVSHTDHKIDYKNAYNYIYSNITNSYRNVFLPNANIVKKQGYKSLFEYFYISYGIEMINKFVSEAQSWAYRLGYTKIK